MSCCPCNLGDLGDPGFFRVARDVHNGLDDLETQLAAIRGEFGEMRAHVAQALDAFDMSDGCPHTFEAQRAAGRLLKLARGPMSKSAFDLVAKMTRQCRLAGYRP